MNSLLQQAVALGVLRPLDAQFARMIGEHNPALQLAAACLSAEAGAGNVCLLLEQLQPDALFDGRHPELALKLWHAAGALDNAGWLQLLTGSEAVGDGSGATPLILQQQRLYLQRMWQSEGEVVSFFEQANRPLPVDENALNQILQQLFPVQSATVDWQKVAAAVAATRRISVISGGPGTGKTTTVARLLAALVQLQPERRLRIQLAAPTGKAAARLTSSLSHASESLPLTQQQRELFPQEASTLHRLLGAQPNSQRMRYHAGNRLHLDVLVVDEASMVDLPMMARLIAALPDSAQVIFLGDRDQLASVEAGAVLGDICHFAELDYSPERAAELTRLTGYPLPSQEASGATVRDSLCLLRHSYRFDAQSGIGQLALAVNQGQSSAAMAALQGGFVDITGYPLADSDDYQHLLQACVAGYRSYLQLVATNAEPAAILADFSRFQLLCALRDGPFGVSGLNERIEASLHYAGLIQRKPGLLGRWYAGRPVMISRNDSTLGLFNGDIGITLASPEDGALRVYFPLPDGSIKSVQPSRLPSHDTAYAMTVHKSQGSEFDHTLLVLPNKVLPLLTRELVYTAITRARKQLSVYAPDNVLRMAIKRPTQRRSGLRVRISG